MQRSTRAREWIQFSDIQGGGQNVLAKTKGGIVINCVSAVSKPKLKHRSIPDRKLEEYTSPLNNRRCIEQNTIY